MTTSEKIIEYLQDRVEKPRILLTPYKRDMWDSLESIYKTAREKGLSVDVMPLPYTYKDRYGQFTEWIMDDWSGIDTIEPRLPKKGEYDVIMFHNPYDHCNRVTSIKPDYYTENFVGLGLLCLVPYGYGVTGYIRPGILNADIVFSENEMAVESILEDGRRAGFNEEQIAEFRKRFVVVGSTKCELDLNQTIPKEWKITGRRVILFATSLVPLLSNPPEELRKYEEILKELTEQDQVVIWRAHPLTSGTIRAMIPQYEYLYNVIRREFESKDNAIIDNTNDYRKAFSVADVLYSVPSSLIPVWKQTGKEIHVI